MELRGGAPQHHGGHPHILVFLGERQIGMHAFLAVR